MTRFLGLRVGDFDMMQRVPYRTIMVYHKDGSSHADTVGTTTSV